MQSLPTGAVNDAWMPNPHSIGLLWQFEMMISIEWNAIYLFYFVQTLCHGNRCFFDIVCFSSEIPITFIENVGLQFNFMNERKIILLSPWSKHFKDFCFNGIKMNDKKVHIKASHIHEHFRNCSIQQHHQENYFDRSSMYVSINPHEMNKILNHSMQICNLRQRAQIRTVSPIIWNDWKIGPSPQPR